VIRSARNPLRGVWYCTRDAKWHIRIQQHRRVIVAKSFHCLGTALAERNAIEALLGTELTRGRHAVASTLPAMQIEDHIRANYSYDPVDGRICKRGVLISDRPNKAGYARIHVCWQGRFKTKLAHRVAFLLMTGAWPNGLVDPINGVRNDNRWCNLRDVSAKENVANVCIVPAHRDIVRRGNRYFRLVPL